MTKNQEENKDIKQEVTPPADPFEGVETFDKQLMKERAIKTAYATAGVLAVAIPVNVAIYYAVEPFALMPPDVLAAIGFVIGLVVGLNTGWNVGLKKGREAVARMKNKQ